MTAPNIMVSSSSIDVLAGNLNKNQIQGNLEVLGNVTVDGTITGNIQGTAPAGTLTGNTLASNVVASSLTSVGVLTSLSVTAPILPGRYLKASLPSAGAVAGQMIYVSDATNTIGTGAICYWNGTNFINVTTGITVV